MLVLYITALSVSDAVYEASIKTAIPEEQQRDKASMGRWGREVA